MTRIMFVCHGNICRSPMAELIFKDMLALRGAEDDFLVASSATSNEEIRNGVGNPVYPPAKAELERHGIDSRVKRAVQLHRSDLDKYDMFICMDDKNARNAARILGDGCEGKISKLLSYTGQDRDVSDPWYSDRFDIAYLDIYDGCRALLDNLLKR